MEFQLLGPLRVGRAGSDIPIGASKIRVLLAALLLDANSVVPTDRLIEVLWGERPPASATASLHNHLRRLRGLLGDEDGKRIRAVAPGFLILVEPGELDTDRFTDLCAAGRAAGQAGQWAKASTDLAAALSLWRGTPLADLPELFGRDARILQLLEARLQALEARIEADLELGRHCGLIEELRTLAVEHPVREVFHQQLMLALYRADRPAEALGAFRALRHTLVDGLGVEPSPHLRELRRRIQEADPGLAAPARPGPVGPRSQLPAGTRVFTGREQELDRLIGYARQAPEGNAAGMVVISAIDGMAGIGKTTLAVHAAHRVREDFPDGQLFLDLHGHSTGLEPLTAGDALDWFLRSLGVPPQAVPQDLAERAAFYRDRLEGTRTLIVLDNASSTAQIRPLLPDTPGCLVLVTSRRRLVGLDDAHPLTLDVLSEADAVALLHKVAGPGRIPAHQSAILELLALCGYVPLAIRIIGARLRYRSTLRIEDLVSRLRDDNARLDHLQDEDRSLTAVFESSYTALPVAEQRLFRLLGLVPGLNVDAYAAASLAGTDHRTAERLLESLLDHNLLTQHTPERYRFHDLIRVYARTLTDQDPPADREAALDRLFDYYQHTAQMADRRLARYTRPDPDTAMATAIPSAVPDLADWTAAQSWMRAERENLLAVISYTTAHAQPARVVALSCAVAAFLRQEGPWPQAAALLHTASVFAGEGGSARPTPCTN
jgi:DNA-binding SARP family transcriptional activator